MTTLDSNETLSIHVQKPMRITKGNNSHIIAPLVLTFFSIGPVYVNVYARFDLMRYYRNKTLRTDARTDNLKQYSRPQTQFAGV